MVIDRTGPLPRCRRAGQRGKDLAGKLLRWETRDQRLSEPARRHAHGFFICRLLPMLLASEAS
jgi:hypothetical protein